MTRSTRSSNSVGIVLVSTRYVPGVEVTERRPFTSTSVRVVPKPRRSSRLRPDVPIAAVEFAWVKVERSCGRRFNMSPSESSPVPSRSSASTEVIGIDASRLGRFKIREPVTTMRSLSLASSDASLGATESFCAKAGVAPNKASDNAVPRISRLVFFMIYSPVDRSTERERLGRKKAGKLQSHKLLMAEILHRHISRQLLCYFCNKRARAGRLRVIRGIWSSCEMNGLS